MTHAWQGVLIWSIICCSFFPNLNAQLSINDIQFDGLKRTKINYLQHFIDSQLGDTLSLSTLKRDLQNLQNLNVIAEGNYHLDTIQQAVNIRFELEEALTVFPILNFGGVRGNFWYQLGFTDDNWRGRGQKLTIFYQNNDRRDNFNLFYKIPYLRDSKWGASLSFMRWASVEPLFFDTQQVFYDYDNLSLGLSGFYEFQRTSNLEFGLTYFVENYFKNERHLDENTPGPAALEQPKLLAKLIHRYQKIDYYFYTLSGFDNRASLQTVYNFQDGTWFHIFLNDTRYFKSIHGKGNLAARFRFGIATNNNSPFAPFVLDSYINIRGSGNRIERGTAALILNLEYRQQLFDINRFAGQFVAFVDTGTWRNPGGEFADLVRTANIQNFAGLGLRLIYKRAFNTILRIDYGIETQDFNRRGFVVGFGQYF